MGGTLGRRGHQQRRRHWEWRPQWHQRCNQRIHSTPCQGSEGCSAEGEMLLPLQQPGTLYPQMPIGEGIQTRSTFKPKGGDNTKEGILDPSRKGNLAKDTPRWDSPRHKMSYKDSLLEYQSLPPMVWIKHVASAWVNGESCMALLDNGMQMNTIMLGFVENCSHDVGPLSDLVGRWVTCVGLENAFTRHMGYVVMWVQVDGVPGYDEDQIALVIPDLSNFVAWVPKMINLLGVRP